MSSDFNDGSFQSVTLTPEDIQRREAGEKLRRDQEHLQQAKARREAAELSGKKFWAAATEIRNTAVSLLVALACMKILGWF